MVINIFHKWDDVANAKRDGAWWYYVLFFIGFGFIWMWF